MAARSSIALALVLMAAVATGAAARIVRSEVADGKVAAMVRIEDLRRDGAVVRARLVNLTNERLVNVRILVSESFRWTDERHPGPDDPSQALAVTVPEALPPRGSVEASVPLPAPPPRHDGTFVLGASVLALDAYPRR